MKQLYPKLYLICFSLTMSPQVFAENGDSLNLGATPVVSADLEQSRGLGGYFNINSNANLDAVLAENTATNNTTGSNTIDQASFSEASGVFSIIQNTGNNVIIQDSTIITVTITPD